MFSFDKLRQRVPTDPGTPKVLASNVVAPGLARILAGVFGVGNPGPGQSSSPSEVFNQFPGSPYHMHEGDIFEPGTGNWVLDPYQEVPVNTLWGHAFLIRPNTWPAYASGVQAYNQSNVQPQGLGGIIAGQYVSQPLSPPEA